MQVTRFAVSGSSSELFPGSYIYKIPLFLSPCWRWRLTRYNSLDLFINSFLGQIPSIWASIPLTLRQKTLDERWTNVLQLLQQSIVDKWIITAMCVCCVHCNYFRKKMHSSRLCFKVFCLSLEVMCFKKLVALMKYFATIVYSSSNSH